MPESLPQPILNTCAACGHRMDVSGAEPFTQQSCPGCASTVRVRTNFDHFTILREVGIGGMSRVFEAEDVSLGRRVALKILNRDCSQDAARLAQFEREARLTANFSHPHIVKVFSVGRDQRHFYIAMELVPGGSLDDRIRASGAQPEAKMLNLAVELVQGLRVAQGAGLIHRDIKPGNILFAADETVKIVDFGLALIQGDLDESEELWATPYYVPPEKLHGEPDTFRGDMYSLGATLFHALAGRPPYGKDSNSIEELKKIKSFPVHLRPVAPHVSEETCAIIDRLLSRKPEHRYRSYDELLEHFEFARKRLQSKAHEARESRWQRQLRPYAGLAAVVAVVLAVAGVMNRTKKSDEADGELKVGAAGDVGGSATARFLQARESLSVGLVPRARAAFEELAAAPTTRQPTLNWALFHAGLCGLLEHDVSGSRRAFARLGENVNGREAVGDPELTLFFSDVSGVLSQGGRANGDEPERFSRGSFRALALLPLGLRAWEDGRTDRAELLLRNFAEFSPPDGYEWINGYQRLVAPYLGDFDAVRRVPQIAPDADRTARETAIAATLKIIDELKVGGGPLRPKLDAQLSEFRRLLADRLKEDEERMSNRSLERSRSEFTAIDEVIDKIRPLRATLKYAQGLDALRALTPETAAARERLADHVYLWQAADDFLRLLADDINAFGFSGTMERTPPLPPIPEATIVRATRDRWLVKAGKVEKMLDLSATTTPAFLLMLAEGYVERIPDSDAYYRRREGMVAFAMLSGLDDYARFAGEILMRESPDFRERWSRAAQLSMR